MQTNRKEGKAVEVGVVVRWDGCVHASERKRTQGTNRQVGGKGSCGGGGNECEVGRVCACIRRKKVMRHKQTERRERLEEAGTVVLEHKNNELTPNRLVSKLTKTIQQNHSLLTSKEVKGGQRLVGILFGILCFVFINRRLLKHHRNTDARKQQKKLNQTFTQ